MKEKAFFLFIMILVFCRISGSSQTKVSAAPGTLTVVINDFRNSLGHANVALFNKGDDFPQLFEKAFRVAYISVENKKSVAVFENLPPGEYAVSVYHDENNNKKMDTNLLGIPKEGVGASNNARGHFGPPKYKNAKFNFSGSSLTITINMVYL